MNRLVFIVLVLVSSLIGCKQLQPVTENYKNDYLKALIDLDQCQKAYLACDTNYNELWQVCYQKIDSLSSGKELISNNDFWKKVYFAPTDSTAQAPKKKLLKELAKRDTMYLYKGVILPGKKEKPQIVYKIHPITWVFAITTLIFAVAYLLLIYKTLKNGRSSTA